MKLTKFLSINEEVDFLNIDVDSDNQYYIDPYLILTSKREDIIPYKISIESFYEEVVRQFQELGTIEKLCCHFQEIKENRLGMSSDGSIMGNSIGEVISLELQKEIMRYLQLYPGLLKGFDDITIFVRGIKDDRISDMTTAICFMQLVEYTKMQCLKHKIPLAITTKKFWMWDKEHCEWANRQVELPMINGDYLIMIPKNIVGRKIRLGSFHEFVSIGVLSYFKKNSERYDIPNRIVVNKKGEFIEKQPTKKSIYEYYSSKGINLFKIDDLLNTFSNDEIDLILKHYKTGSNSFKSYN